MGYFKREFVIGIDYGLYKNADDSYTKKHNEKLKKILSLMQEKPEWFTVSKELTNGYVNYVMFWDGSKEGWDTSDEANQLREQFIDLLRDLGAYIYHVEDGEDYDKPILSSHKQEYLTKEANGQ